MNSLHKFQTDILEKRLGLVGTLPPFNSGKFPKFCTFKRLPQVLFQKIKTFFLRHKKSLKQRTPSTSRQPSILEDDAGSCSNEDIVISEDIDVDNSEEIIPEELRLTHRQVDMFLKISGDVAGMDCILVDDMIDTGSTIRLALEVLHSHNAGY